MPQENKNSRKSSWINVVVLALLLVTGGFTLTACQQAESEGESVREEREEKNQPTKANENNEEDEEKDEDDDEAKDTQEDDDPE